MSCLLKFLWCIVGKGTERGMDYDRFVKLLCAFMRTDTSDTNENLLAFFLPEWFNHWYFKKEYQEAADKQTAVMEFVKV